MSELNNIGTTALMAFQRALQTTSNNVANVGTEGYSRQRVDLASRPAQLSSGGYIGSGVALEGVSRLSDAFLVRQSLSHDAEHGRLETLVGLSQRVDSLLSDPASGLAGPLGRLFDSFSALEANPAGNAERQGVLSSAAQLVARFGGLDGQLDAMVSETNQRLDGVVDEVNRLAAEVVRLNREIPEAIARGNGQPPNDLLDQRDRLVRDLSSRLAIEVQDADDGSVNIYTRSGLALVVGQTQLQLGSRPDPLDGTRRQLVLGGNGVQTPLGNTAIGGQIGGLVDFRREVLDPARAELGRVAVGLVDSVNTIHAQGVDLQGSAGRPLFGDIEPLVSAAPANTGSGRLSASFDEIALLEAGDYRLRFDGSAFTAVRAATGEAVPLGGSGTASDPLSLPGLSLVLSGNPAAGDEFLLRPASHAGAVIELAIAAPGELAAASPVSATAALDNLGEARARVGAVVDAGAAGFGAAASLVFESATRFRVDGGALRDFVPGEPITVNGVELRIDGQPAAGDRFGLQATGAGSSDGGVAAQLSALRTQRLFDGGTRSLGEANAALASGIGVTALNAELQFEAVGIVREQVEQDLQAVSGVNLDEEAARLMQYQQSYEAAAQILRIADEIFATLLQAVSR